MAISENEAIVDVNDDDAGDADKVAGAGAFLMPWITSTMDIDGSQIWPFTEITILFCHMFK